MSIKKSILYLLVSLLIAGQASAAIQIKGKFKNWESHFTKQGDDLICFAISMPMTMEPKNLNRAEARIFVTFRTKDNIRDEVSVTVGYPYKKNIPVDVSIGSNNFKFSSSEKFAWLPGKNDEIKIVRQMKRGNQAKVIGISARGNKTTDTYSLLGFTDAYNSAKNQCKK